MAQQFPAEPAASAPATKSADVLASSESAAWTVGVSTYIYSVPDDRDYVQPELTIDRDWLHLEARYNYEDFDTASAWIGWNFSVGEKLTFDFTPMLGGVFGDTQGIAPGCEFTLNWRGFSLYNESEYVIDTDTPSESFYFSWTELTYYPVEWFRFGWIDQLTKTNGEKVIDDNGPMLGVTCKNLDCTLYLLHVDDDRPTVVVGLSLTFPF